ncbi:DUF262 domain-containing protein (plasmid) [Paraburkholderia sp. A1BS-2L]|uniref:HNH endonuclease family protein n=1 Tax=unclassified Paraburkholderia TaxID=2615204 RepID=UPI003DAA140F
MNLDALIPRDDFESVTDSPLVSLSLAAGLKVNELESHGLTYLTLRKPDFQRETASWDPEKVVDLVESFLDGDLIPALILWRSPTSGNIFVIDGAHRLSALIAWVHDDYGASSKSLDFFENLVTPEQVEAATKCRALIESRIGSYKKLTLALQKPENSTAEQVRRARNMAVLQVQLQWVSGDAKKAEASFFKINQKATAINATELAMLKSRRKPNAIATRAIIRAGVGHKYWSGFPEEVQQSIQRLAREIYDNLFTPVLETPIKTLDLPVAGRGYSAESVKLVFDFVNLANSLSLRGKQEDDLEDDLSGDETVRFLKSVKRLSNLISGAHPGSLGLHPAVYFYSLGGRYQPSAFLATAKLLDDFDRTNAFPRFTDVRKKFEDFLVKHRYLVNHVAGKFGSGPRSMEPILGMYRTIISCLYGNADEEEIFKRFREDPKTITLAPYTEEEQRAGRNFRSETKSAIYLKEAIDNAPRCQICGARIHKKAVTIDHIKRKADGGLGTFENGQLAHPYCNTGYKEHNVSGSIAR